MTLTQCVGLQVYRVRDVCFFAYLAKNDFKRYFKKLKIFFLLSDFLERVDLQRL